MDQNNQSVSANQLKAIVEEVVNKAVDPIKEDLKEVKETLQAHTKTLQAHTGSLMTIEATTNGYADAYKTNKANIERLDERLSTMEEQLEIQPSDQLAIQR